MKGDSTHTSEVTGQVEKKSFPTARECGFQLTKYPFAQVINFKKADRCQAALHTYVLKTRQYQPALYFISLPQFEHHILLRTCLPLCSQRH